ncbi:MAG: hypothetical protein ACYC54_07815 [Sedimentisphaerales bacterium]
MNQAKTQISTNGLFSRINSRQTLGVGDDHQTEELLQADARSPLGQLLSKIAELPEVRFEKVLTVRRQICGGLYRTDEKLDATIDRMLEDLLIEP